MSDGSSHMGDPGGVDQVLLAHSDALLDSLFADDPVSERPVTPTPSDSVPISAVHPTAQDMPLDSAPPPEGTAKPPPVNPAGPARREPFTKSPRAPVASERRPTVVSLGLRRAPVKPTPRPPAPAAARPVLEIDWIDRARSAADRATWLENEAAQQTDDPRKGRLLLVASEVWARAGDRDAALRTARRACELLPQSALAHRQLRQLCLQAGDARGALAALDVELAHGAAEARAHLLGLRAALCSSALTDAAGLASALDDLAAVAANDPRPTLYRLAQQLVASPAAPPALAGEERLSPALSTALRQVRELRNAAADPTSTNPESPALRFERARRALAERDAPRAAQAVTDLGKIPSLLAAAQWLSAALNDAAGNELGRETLRLIGERQTDGVSAADRPQRALARNALRSGDAQSLRAALVSDDASSFSPLERLCLAALVIPSWEIPDKWFDALVRDRGATAQALRPLLEHAPELPGDVEWTASSIGRALTRQGPLPDAALTALATSNDPAALVLDLEQRAQAGDKAGVARGLAEWSRQAQWPELKLLAAWLHELAGERDTARHLCEALVHERPAGEAALRMASDLGSTVGSRELEALARACSQPDRAALLFLEAAQRSESRAERLRLLSSSAERCPALPFAQRRASALAREERDFATLLEWLEKSRSAHTEPGCWALMATQTALLIGDSDRAQAAQLIAETAAAFPQDLSLQQWGERVVAVAWGSWREALANNLSYAGDRERLLLEAALHEQDRSLSDAVRLAEAAQHGTTSGLARYLHSHWADQLAHPSWPRQLEIQLEQETDTGSRQQGYARLGQLAQLAANVPLAQRAWQKLQAAVPNSLPALRGLEQLQISTDALTDLAQTSALLSLLLPGDEGSDHALFHLRTMPATQRDETSDRVLAHLLEQAEPPPEVLRIALLRCRQAGDVSGELALTLLLAERAHATEDVAALCLHAARLTQALGDLEQTAALLERTLNAVPGHLVALSLQAHLYERLEQWPATAQALGALAAASQVPLHRARALHAAGSIWLDRLQDDERGEAALEAAASLMPDDEALHERLCQHYLDTQQRVKLSELLDARLARIPDGEQKERLRRLRDQTQEQIGGTPQPRSVIPLVDASPEHHDALEAYARQALASGDEKGAEGAWLQLVRVVQEPEKQAEHYRGLAELYARSGRNLARALVCYDEVRKRLPHDIDAGEQLITLCEKLDRGERAIQLQMELLAGARNDNERRRWTVRLAQLQASCARDLEHAELTLQQARKTWPHDSEVLRALAELYRSSGQEVEFTLLLDRASKDARNLLSVGELEPAPFELLATVAELQHAPDSAVVIRASRAALTGRSSALSGMGALAGSLAVDKFLMPETLSPALSTLLAEVGGALEQGREIEQPAGGTLPLANLDSQLDRHCRELARGFGIAEIDLQVSDHGKPEAIATSCDPASILFTRGLLDLADQPLSLFFFYRALKLISSRSAALLDPRANDGSRRLTALLCCFAPDWQPPGVDRARLQPLRDQIAAALPNADAADLTRLAREVITSYGLRPGQVAQLVERWVTRTALLASGNPNVALRALSVLATGSPDLPEDPAERRRFITKSPLACDLILFSVSEEYAAARRELRS